MYDSVIHGVSDLLTYDPLSRVVRTDHPNGSYSRVLFGELTLSGKDWVPVVNPWGQVTYDENDTVGELNNPWYAAFSTGTPTQVDSATKAFAHADTPTRVHFDPLGRSCQTEQDNGFDASGNPQLFATTLTLDLQGNQWKVHDARLPSTMPVATTIFDMLKRPLAVLSVDAGQTTTFPDVVGTATDEWTANGAHIARAYDPLRRPLSVRVTEASGTRLVERTFYGEPLGAAANANKLERRGVPSTRRRTGLVTHSSYDFKGNLLTSTRQLATDYEFAQINWPVLADLTTTDPTWLPPSVLAEAFTTSIAYDALNRQTRVEMERAGGQSDVATPAYNEAGLLGNIERAGRRSGERDGVCHRALSTYNEKEQRLGIAYGNGVATAYTYELTTFRLSTLQTTKSTAGDLQSLTYTYDPVGNITTIADAAQQTLYVGNSQINPSTTYTYDPIYRLTNAVGREHISQSTPDQTLAPPWVSSNTESQRCDGDAQLRRVVPIRRRWQFHRDGPRSDQQRRSIPKPVDAHVCDRRCVEPSATDHPRQRSHSNNEVHLRQRSCQRRRQHDVDGGDVPRLGLQKSAHPGDNVSGHETYFQYDAAGQRVRKTLLPATGKTGSLQERFYLAGYELYRERTITAAAPSLERRTLDIVDGKRKIALVELPHRG